MQLTEMLQIAAQKTEEIQKLEGDWFRQIEEVNKAIKQVSDWQKQIFDVFGAPKLNSWSSNARNMRVGEVLQLNPHGAYDYVKESVTAQEDIYEQPSGQVVSNGTAIWVGTPLVVPAPRLIHKKGETYKISRAVNYHIDGYNYPEVGLANISATILQGLYHNASAQTVTYKATLKTDENAFLAQMLPQTTIVQRDPDYTLFDLTIKVPREQLVKESLHILSERLNNPKANPPPPPKKQPKRRFPF